MLLPKKKIIEFNASRDMFWMIKTLELAQKAASEDEVPVGALIVMNDRLIASAYNRKEKWQTPLAHAEVIAVHRASIRLKSWRLPQGVTLYSSLEPCVMCAGLLVQARVSRVVYGASDPKGGGLETLYKIGSDPRLNHRIEIVGGQMAEESSKILKDFFKKKREKK